MEILSDAPLHLLIPGLIAGFIDAIAGGGGLITVPTLILFMGAGATVIGTNKIVGFTAAFLALIVYARKGHLDWRSSALFTVFISVGSFLGSKVSPFLPPQFFKFLVLITCPLILVVVFKKDLWIARTPQETAQAKGQSNTIALIVSGLSVGFYDGAWGPGGGTFMFLSLLFVAKQPLLMAIAGSKVANSASAGASLLGYALDGHVQYIPGLIMALGSGTGAFVGARFASKKAAQIVRPVLAIVATLLALKVISNL